jgi:2-oxoglutarate ferredoxin oxidoreductase subunit beta
VVYSGDGDLIAIGGNHFIHAARRNADLKVICVNNFIYGMTGGQVAPTTPVGAVATTSPYGCFERPFNLPYLVESSGAVYVARWTAFHVRHIARSMVEAFNKKGFCFIEIVTPCPTLYQRRNRLGDSLDTMRYYKQKSVIKNGANTKDLDITFQSEIVVGKFVDIERPTLLESMDQQLRQTLKDRYAGRGGQA